MFDDALAHFERQIQAGEIQITLLEFLHNAQRVQVVIERTSVWSHQRIQRAFARMTKRGMADIVHEPQRLRQLGVEAQRGGNRARYLGHFQCVGQTIAKMIRKTRGEYLRLGFQPAKSTRMDDAVAISRIFTAIGMWRLRITPPAGMLCAHSPRR